MTPRRDALGIGVVSSLGGTRLSKLVGIKLVGVGGVVTGNGARALLRLHTLPVDISIPGAQGHPWYAPWEEPAFFHSAGSLV